MLPQARPLTWSLLKVTLNNVRQMRCMCAVSASLYQKKGSWAPALKTGTMLEIEKIWKERLQAYDKELSSSSRQSGQPKFYALSMFPYPSGKLHMGHVRVYTISDMMARYQRMLGKEVIHPMGWDAFGLPAENAAIERNLYPKDWTLDNIDTMKQQLTNLCCSFDWERELATCDPAYYRWTQYIFLKMFDAGLAYQRNASVNWDPVDQTVLADEQIDDEGCSWRSGAKVEKRYLKQWYIRTTAYAQRLMEGLKTVDADLWGDIVQSQRHWIGECTGCRLDFHLQEVSGEQLDPLSVFTTSPEAAYGVSHIVLATSHRYNDPKYYKQVVKEGKEIELSLSAVHPFTGQLIPMIVSAMAESTMMGNDSHQGIPCLCETAKEVADMHGYVWKQVFSGEGENQTLTSSEQLDGMTREAAAKCVMTEAQEKKYGGYPVSAHLRDWLISRQRYWGTPIPMIHCDTCQAVPVPYEDLPVKLPDTAQPSVGKGQSVLQDNQDWINVPCPRCGGPAKRETDTMDTFVDSSWYFYRYLDPNNLSEPVSREQADKYMPVDLYIGGKEHAYMHLYYARFFSHFLYDLGLTSHQEPFVNLLTQGMVKGMSYKLTQSGIYIHPDDVTQRDGKFFQKNTDMPVTVKYEKMSKSKYNGVDPEELFAVYGVDMTRLCILSNVAPKSDRNWNNEVYKGVQTWLNRVWGLVGLLINRDSFEKSEDQELCQKWENLIRENRNKKLLEINYNLNKSFMFNGAISRMHEFSSDLKNVPAEVAVSCPMFERAVSDLVVMLAPFCPMFSSELWTVLRNIVSSNTGYDNTKCVLDQRWPQPDQDTPVPVAFRCNTRYVGKTFVEYHELGQLTKERLLRQFLEKDIHSGLDSIVEHSRLDIQSTKATVLMSVSDSELFEAIVSSKQDGSASEQESETLETDKKGKRKKNKKKKKKDKEVKEKEEENRGEIV